MSKKLTFLIVALECVFAVFLISIFGPMIESLHTVIIVDDIHFINENGEAIENESSVFVDLQVSRSFHYDFVLSPSNATNKSVKIIHNKTDEEIEIEADADGTGFTVHFLSKNISSVKITVRANDSSQKQATIIINKKMTNVEIDDF